MNWSGKSALVTGASRGLGRALAARLARAGATVVLVARDESAVEAAADSIRRDGGRAFAIASDVGDEDSAHRIAGRAAALAGSIDVLVHNASTLGPVPLAALLDTHDDDFERALAVNLVGPFRLTKAFVGGMALRESGLVVFISSDAAIHAYPSWGAYAVSKAAADHLARIWSAELASTGVKVVAVDPGEMDTTMHSDAMPNADRRALASPASVADRIVRFVAHDGGWETGARFVVPAGTVAP